MSQLKLSTSTPSRPNADLEERAASVRHGKGKLLTPKGEAAANPAQQPPMGQGRDALAIGTALEDTGLTSEVSEDVCAAIEDHGEAIAVGLAEPNEADTIFNQHAARQNETDAALRNTPARSLADLRAKLTYLIPIMAPDMLDGTHVAHLEAIRTDMDRLCRERSHPAGNQDNDLLRLGDQLDRAHAHWRVMHRRNREPQERFLVHIEVAKAAGVPTIQAHEAAWDLPGVREAARAEDDAYDAVSTISNAIWALPHTTAAGLAVKARAALTDIFGGGNYGRDAALSENEEVVPQRMRLLIEACCTLAGVDWRGDPIALPAPDPIFAAIQAQIAAHEAFGAVANFADKPWRREHGLDTSDEAMAPAEAAWDATSAAETQAWIAVTETRPTTMPGVLALLRHAQRYAAGNDGVVGAPAMEDLFGIIADRLADLTGTETEV